MRFQCDRQRLEKPLKCIVSRERTKHTHSTLTDERATIVVVVGVDVVVVVVVVGLITVRCGCLRVNYKPSQLVIQSARR